MADTKYRYKYPRLRIGFFVRVTKFFLNCGCVIVIVSHFHGNPTRLPFPWGIPFTRMLCDRAAGGGDIPVPSHIFVILLKCSSDSCDKQQYDSLAFILPQIYPASECLVRTTDVLLLFG